MPVVNEKGLVELPGLRRVRQARTLSLRDLAKMVGTYHPTILRIEQGQPCRASMARRLATALRVDLEELASEEGSGVQLRPLGTPLDAAKEQAAKLELREKRGEGKLDNFWLGQMVAADAAIEDTLKLVREFEWDPENRNEALDLLDRFAALSHRAAVEYLALHNLTLADALSNEPLEAEDRGKRLT